MSGRRARKGTEEGVRGEISDGAEEEDDERVGVPESFGEPGEEGTAQCPGGGPDADDGGDGGGGEGVAGRVVEVGGPALVSGGGKGEKGDGGPYVSGGQAGHQRDQHDGKGTKGAEEECKAAAALDGAEAGLEPGSEGPDPGRPDRSECGIGGLGVWARGDWGRLASSVAHAGSRKPAAEDGAERRAEVDDDDGRPEVGEGEAVGLVEVLGEPEEVEPPDGVGEELGEGEGPDAALAEKAEVGGLGGREARG